MKQYLNLMQNVLENGSWQENRTGIRTMMLPGAMLQFDLREGFPAVTTKKLAYKAVVGELLGFLRGYDTVKEFNDLGCKVWDANATAPAWLANPHNNPNIRHLDWETDMMVPSGYLGRIYGVQWRNWNCNQIPGKHTTLDQIETLLCQIQDNPTSRRLLVSAWRPDELDQMALPPCHYAFQVIIEQETKTMHLLWNQRSCDLFLGVPFNIASYATLLHILARITGYNVGTLTGFLADVHIYENHINQCCEQLSRDPKPLPELVICSTIKQGSSVESVRPDDILLNNYEYWPAIKADMAV
jgi:thymidylate synthase